VAQRAALQPTLQHRTLVESALRHERAVLVTVLILIPVICWSWIAVMARDMYGTMRGASAWMMTPVWDWPHVLLLWAMWAVMMAAMMLPSATPIILLYAGTARSRADSGGAAVQVYLLVAGYLFVWAIFSIGATALQRALATVAVLTPMMEVASSRASAVVLVVAGLYQFTPLKQVCLQACRSPLTFLMQHWRTGYAGTFRMGAEHGLYCVGCCWALMLVLFAGGVMNLAVIVGLTIWVILEKIAPFGEQTAYVSGALLLAIAGWIVLR
jgi:predicted metal-binding membrane protein